MRYTSPGFIEFTHAAGVTTKPTFTDSGLLQAFQDPLGAGGRSRVPSTTKGEEVTTRDSWGNSLTMQVQLT